MRADIIKDVIFEFPNASKERTEALAYRRMNEQKELELKQATYADFNDPELTLKPDLSKTLKHKKVRKWYHNGKWEMNAREQAECWSCCMSYDKEGEGCVMAN